LKLNKTLVSKTLIQT